MRRRGVVMRGMAHGIPVRCRWNGDSARQPFSCGTHEAPLSVHPPARQPGSRATSGRLQRLPGYSDREHVAKHPVEACVKNRVGFCASSVIVRQEMRCHLTHGSLPSQKGRFPVADKGLRMDGQEAGRLWATTLRTPCPSCALCQCVPIMSHGSLFRVRLRPSLSEALFFEAVSK